MDTYSPVNPPMALEERIDAALSNLESWFGRVGTRWDAAVRESPRKSIAMAAAAGALSHQLPMSTALRCVLKSLMAVAPPALAVVGAIQVARHLRRMDDARLEGGNDGDSRFGRGGDQSRGTETEHLIIVSESASAPSGPVAGVVG